MSLEITSTVVSRALPRTVVVLGLVSLLNDAASEMITPLLPILLTTILGAGPAIVGLVEGAAEAVASVLKLVSGWLADRGWSAKRLVFAGYGASNLVRPLIALATAWPVVFALRFVDRIGKGIRSAPRDALIASTTDVRIRGHAFGFHRSMDHAGAVIGPVAAFLLLSSQVSLPHVFYWSAVPGICVLLLIAFGVPGTVQPAIPPTQSKLSWRGLDVRIRSMIVAAGGLALASVPEVFIVLWALDRGLDVVWVPLVWAAASVMKMLTAWPAGRLSDRFGRLTVLTAGWSLRVASLIALASISADGVAVWVLFLVYSASLASTEAAERSLIGDHAKEQERGTVFGAYHLASGLLQLPGAFLFGVIWETTGSAMAFAIAAATTAIAAIAMLLIGRRARAETAHG